MNISTSSKGDTVKTPARRLKSIGMMMAILLGFALSLRAYSCADCPTIGGQSASGCMSSETGLWCGYPDGGEYRKGILQKN
jgi:hypothetical protein